MVRDVWAVRIKTKNKSMGVFWFMVGKTKVKNEKKTKGVTIVRTHDSEARAGTRRPMSSVMLKVKRDHYPGHF